MSMQIRQKIEDLVNEAWDLHDKANSPQEAEEYKKDIMELLSKLPENEERLRIVQ